MRSNLNMSSVADQIVEWMLKLVNDAGAEGLIVGLSGGIDSATTAALAKRAVGDKMLGVLMPCHSSSIDTRYAQMVAQRFDIATTQVNLGSIFDEMVAVLHESSKHHPVVSIDSTRMATANLKPRLRMATLYYLAAANHYLVAGTGNKSELLIGYFTKYGDGGVDMEPLGALYKFEVRALAHHLGVPQSVIDRPPTAGLWEDQTDEGEMGLSYQTLDSVLMAIEEQETASVAPEALARVRGMMISSEHKRHLPPVCPIRRPSRAE